MFIRPVGWYGPIVPVYNLTLYRWFCTIVQKDCDVCGDMTPLVTRLHLTKLRDELTRSIVFDSPFGIKSIDIRRDNLNSLRDGFNMLLGTETYLFKVIPTNINGEP